MTESVYVHIDTTSNAVLTKGLTSQVHNLEIGRAHV